MKKTTSQKLSKRLSHYGALSVAISGVAIANGQSGIFYKDIDPDVGGPGEFYQYDFDGDGTLDFAIAHFNSLTSSGFYNYNTLAVGPLRSSNAFFGYNNGPWFYPFALASDVIISNNMVVSSDSNSGATVFGAWQNAAFQTLNVSNCAWSFSNWCANSGNKFLGLRFTISDLSGTTTHYGWVRIEVRSDVSDWLIKDYAYNKTPDAPIKAGQTTLGIEENSLSKVKVVGLNKSIGLYNLLEASNYIVYNLTGQEILRGMANRGDYVIDAKTLAGGIYIVELSDKTSNAILRKKVVLQ